MFESRAGVACVDVHLQRLGVADHQERVPEALELVLDRAGVEVFSLDHERRAVPVARELMVDRLDADLPELGCSLRKRLAGDGCGKAADDLEQAGTPCVHDTSLAQNGELVGRSRDRLLPTADERGEQVGDREPLVGERLCLLRKFADDGEHRPLDGVADRSVGGVACRAEGTRQPARVDLRRPAKGLGRPAEDLGEDDAGVAACAHQGGPAQLLHDLGPVGRGRAFDLLHDRAARQGQVRTGVAVRDGVDVQVVDAGPAALNRCEGPSSKLADAVEVACRLGSCGSAHADRRTSWMRTSTSFTVTPVRRSTS